MNTPRWVGVRRGNTSVVLDRATGVGVTTITTRRCVPDLEVPRLVVVEPQTPERLTATELDV